MLTDVGGDVLAHGHEAGLGSPLADAVCLAAAPRLAERGIAQLLALFGAGCDGELTPAEVAERVAEVAAAGGYLGAWGPGTAELERLDAAVAQIPTEASTMALRCARGAVGTAPIRDGRRTSSSRWPAASCSSSTRSSPCAAPPAARGSSSTRRRWRRPTRSCSATASPPSSTGSPPSRRPPARLTPAAK